MAFTHLKSIWIVVFCVSRIHASPSGQLFGGFEKALGPSQEGYSAATSMSDPGYSPSSKCLPSLDYLLERYHPKGIKNPSEPPKTTKNLPSRPNPHDSAPSSTSIHKSLSKRTLSTSEVSDIARLGENYVSINWVRSKSWRRQDGSPLEQGSLGTAGLCGCTVLVIWSSHATILAHIEEARAQTFPWWSEDGKPSQDEKDQLFLAKAYELTARHLLDTTTTTQHHNNHNNHNHNFPPGETHAFIIAPHMNPADKAHRAIRLPHDWYYRHQVAGLESMFSNQFRIPYTLMPFLPTSSRSPDFRIDGKDTVLVHIEEKGDNLALRLYLNGRVTDEYMDLGRRGSKAEAESPSPKESSTVSSSSVQHV